MPAQVKLPFTVIKLESKRTFEARVKSKDLSLEYRQGGRKTEEHHVATGILDTENHIANDTDGIVAFGKEDAFTQGDGRVITFYEKIETDLRELDKRFTRLDNLLNSPEKNLK